MEPFSIYFDFFESLGWISFGEFRYGNNHQIKFNGWINSDFVVVTLKVNTDTNDLCISARSIRNESYVLDKYLLDNREKLREIKIKYLEV